MFRNRISQLCRVTWKIEKLKSFIEKLNMSIWGRAQNVHLFGVSWGGGVGHLADTIFR